MNKRVTIPVKVMEQATAPVKEEPEELETPNAQTGTLSGQAVELEPLESQNGQRPEVPASENGWRDQALRLQADMDNFRKRQQRLAQDRIEEERQRLLGLFLLVLDDLERALAAPSGDNEALRQGLQLTHRKALQLLHKEGVEPIEAQYQPFDPQWHEAVAMLSRDSQNVAPNTVVQVVESGYRLGDRLLRPAKVVVAV
ncbi:MAG: nucleotide exchange factor GrpE [Anaerolineae bacterium]